MWLIILLIHLQIHVLLACSYPHPQMLGVLGKRWAPRPLQSQNARQHAQHAQESSPTIVLCGAQALGSDNWEDRGDACTISTPVSFFPPLHQNGQCSFSAPCQGQGVTLIGHTAYPGSALRLFSIRLLFTFPTCLFQHLNMKISRHGEIVNESYNEYSYSFVQYSIIQWIYLYYIPIHLSNHQVPRFAVLLKIFILREL